MKRTVLIPTDFTIESLNLLKYALQVPDENKVNVVLVLGLRLSDSIMDLLFLSRKEEVENLMSDDFKTACKIMRNKYAGRLNSFRIEIFSGFTQSSFRNFLEGNQITEIFIPRDYVLKSPAKKSFALMPFIQANKYLVTEVSWEPVLNVPEKNQVAEVFLI